MALQELGDEDQQHSGKKEPEECKPFRGNALVNEEKLSRNAAGTPENGPQGRRKDPLFSVSCHEKTSL